MVNDSQGMSKRCITFLASFICGLQQSKLSVNSTPVLLINQHILRGRSRLKTRPAPLQTPIYLLFTSPVQCYCNINRVFQAIFFFLRSWINIKHTIIWDKFMTILLLRTFKWGYIEFVASFSLGLCQRRIESELEMKEAPITLCRLYLSHSLDKPRLTKTKDLQGQSFIFHSRILDLWVNIIITILYCNVQYIIVLQLVCLTLHN